MIITDFSLNLQQELALFIKLPNKNYSYETEKVYFCDSRCHSAVSD